MSNLSVRILTRLKHSLTLQCEEFKRMGMLNYQIYDLILQQLAQIEKEETEFESRIECETERKCDQMREREKLDIYDL